MIGELYINDKDAFSTWGVCLENGSEEKLLKPANNKEYASNNARSQPGKQVFVSNPQPEDRDVILVLCISSTSKANYLTSYRNLVNELNDGMITFRVPSIGIEFKFYCIGFQDLSFYERIGKLSVRFNEPNPKDREYD